MVVRRFWERTRDFTVNWAGRVFIFGLFAAATLAVLLGAAVHHTAQPEFCNSCHIMEPYFASWQDSSHHGVACIDCHYEPGSLETLEGKFKALSQLAKYVTRTQGTKPWAEVSDSSCERSGCHSTRMLDGPVAFGSVNFDHRQHLLESRRGRRLRCTTCHAQVDQTKHVSVAKTVCFTCHFMPDEHGQLPEKTSDCMICHGPPSEEILVDGQPFQHRDYVARGVDCRECHDPVIEGKGTVRKERCHSCHGEAGHLERIGEREFLHEMHVTEHKVECFECHDEIHHGLLPLAKFEPASKEGCGACHDNSHDAARKLYMGQGAVGVADEPSRMHQTRVVCNACHTGRSGFLVGHVPSTAAQAVAMIPNAIDGDGSASHPAHTPAATVAAAGNIDCIHCHGPRFDGMLAEWQSTVGEQLERLAPQLSELRATLGDRTLHPAAEPLREAEANFLLVSLDGSRGAHNVGYALDALRASAERIDRARELLGLTSASAAAAEFPARSEHGCSDCHASVGRPLEVSREERAFPHRKHIAAGLDCDKCHSTTEHGRPAFPRDQCASCHHQESERFDVAECSGCHGAQTAMLRGTLSGLAEPKPGPMGEMECNECHGDAPAIVRPKPAMCVVCHEAGYDAKQREWQAGIAASVERLRAALDGAAGRGATPAALESARAALEAVGRDGSGGVHNFDLASFLLEEALKALPPP